MAQGVNIEEPGNPMVGYRPLDAHGGLGAIKSLTRIGFDEVCQVCAFRIFWCLRDVLVLTLGFVNPALLVVLNTSSSEVTPELKANEPETPESWRIIQTRGFRF